jgi:hypothetical protein
MLFYRYFKIFLVNTILTTVIVFGSINSKGSNSCLQLFTERNNSEFFGYFDLNTVDRKRIDLIRRDLLSKKMIERDDLVSLSGHPKKLTRDLEVQFPQDNGLFTRVAIYGEPYLENGVWFVDFKIWSRDWGGERLKHDRDSVYLRRMTLEQFVTIGKQGFISSLKYGSKLVLIESGNNKFELLPITEISEYDGEVAVLLSNQKHFTYPLIEIIKWNLAVKNDDLSLFSNFIISGGKGSILYAPAEFSISNFEHGRHYLIVETMPESSFEKLQFLIPIADRLLAAINDNITIALVGPSNGIHAASGIKLGSHTFSNHVLIVTPTSTKYILDHELKHIEDRKNKLSAQVIADLKIRFPEGETGGLSPLTLARIFTLISEQRAYQTQYESMKKDAAQLDSVIIYGTYDERKVSFADFLKSEKVHKKIFKDLYLTPLKKELDILKQSNFDDWNFLKGLVMKYCLPSSDFSVTELFAP